jgi:RNA polymerase sigma-70 factor (ECF subfamily)
MHTTSPSLLERLRQPTAGDDWGRFVGLYTPLLYYWCRRQRLPEEESADVVQDVFLVLLEQLPEFQYDGRRSFRGWLRTITLNKCRDRGRRLALAPRGPGGDLLANLPDRANPDPFEEAEYRQYLAARALRLMQSDFDPKTWKACWEHGVIGRPAAEVAAELGVSENAVYIAKCRVLRRLREELQGLWE